MVAASCRMFSYGTMADQSMNRPVIGESQRLTHRESAIIAEKFIAEEMTVSTPTYAILFRIPAPLCNLASSCPSVELLSLSFHLTMAFTTVLVNPRQWFSFYELFHDFQTFQGVVPLGSENRVLLSYRCFTYEWPEPYALELIFLHFECLDIRFSIAVKYPLTYVVACTYSTPARPEA